MTPFDHTVMVGVQGDLGGASTAALRITRALLSYAFTIPWP